MINKQIEILKDCGLEIHDRDDFDYVIDHISYSDASDCVSAYYRPAEIDDEEEYNENKRIHQREVRAWKSKQVS